jgi:hypothetical protein
MKYRYIRLQLEIVCIFKKNDEIIALEKRKLDILGKERTVKEDDDLTYECFKSLLPHMKCLPHIRRPRLHWERFFSEYFSFPTVIVILPVFHTHSFICHRCYMILASESFDMVQAVANLSPQRSGFDLRSVRLGSVLDKMALFSLW